MVEVILVTPEGEEFVAQIDEAAEEAILKEDILAALELEGEVSDYDFTLMQGLKLLDGAKIRIEKLRRRAVVLREPTSTVRIKKK